MQEITLQELKKLKKKFDKNNKLVVLRNALSRNLINDVVFVNDGVNHNLDSFNVEVKTMPVCNQRQSGRCWIFAGLNVLREHIAKQLGINNFQLSQNYISFFDKLEKSNYAMQNLISIRNKEIGDRELDFILNEPVNDGGQWDMFVSLIKKYGVMPKANHYETKQSENTMISDKLVNSSLRQFASLVRGKTDDECEKLRLEYLEKFFNLFVASFGYATETFNFTYKDKDGNLVDLGEFTPQSFSKHFGIDTLIDEYQSVVSAPTKDKAFNKTYTVKFLGNVAGGKEVVHLNVDFDRFEQLIIEQLKNDEVVWFGSDVSYYGDRIGGLWDTNSFDYKTAFDLDFVMDKADSLDYRQSMMNHAMVITGVNLDKNNLPTRWKIENSWGDEIGRKGYFVMSEDFFKLYTYQAVIKKKYLNKTETKALEGKVTELAPWDPLGTLAK